MVPSPNETLEILDKVNTFYESAWDKLIISSSIIIGVVGIILPILIQYWQQNNLKLREEALESKLDSKFSMMKAELEIKLKAEMHTEHEKEITFLKNELELVRANVNGNTFFLQGGASLDVDDYETAFSDYIKACNYYLKTSDWSTIQDSLENISLCIEKLTKSKIEECYRKDDVNLEETLAKITEQDDRHLLLVQVKEIKEQLHRKKAIKVAPVKKNP